MPTLSARIIELLQHRSGLSDREITDILVGAGVPQASVNQACRSLAKRGLLSRRKRSDGRLGNYLLDSNSENPLLQTPRSLSTQGNDPLSEDSIKSVLQSWLEEQRWQVRIAWGRTRGIDIEAFRDDQRWIIEVKGRGSLQPMRVNYFLSALGETLQRMDDRNAKYSIALPDLQQFRSLWDRFPDLAKSRIEITALFVDEKGNVRHVI